MDYLGLLKGTTEIVVSIGASAIVGNAIKLTKAPDAKLPIRIATGIGAFVISSMIGEAAGKYATKQIDDAADRVKELFHKVEEKVITEEDAIRFTDGLETQLENAKNITPEDKVHVDPETKEYKKSDKQEGE